MEDTSPDESWILRWSQSDLRSSGKRWPINPQSMSQIVSFSAELPLAHVYPGAQATPTYSTCPTDLQFFHLLSLKCLNRVSKELPHFQVPKPQICLHLWFCMPKFVLFWLALLCLSFYMLLFIVVFIQRPNIQGLTLKYTGKGKRSPLENPKNGWWE